MSKKGLALATMLILLMLVAPLIVGAPFVAYANGDSHSETIYTAKAYADKVGGHIVVYSEPTTDSQVLTEIIDGTSLAVLESGTEGFHKVILDDGIGYVRSENLTTTLSYNQRVAIAIGLVCVIAVVLILIITYYRRNANYFKSKK